MDHLMSFYDPRASDPHKALVELVPPVGRGQQDIHYTSFMTPLRSVNSWTTKAMFKYLSSLFQTSPQPRDEADPADLNDYPKAVEAVAPKILRSVHALQRIAAQSPNDAEAAFRAEAAVRFCHENKDFNNLLEKLDTEYIVKEGQRSTKCYGSVTGNSASRLPAEVYQHIVHFVDVDSEFPLGSTHKDRIKGLSNIAVSCKTLKPFAECLLYRRPPQLTTVQQQWLFRFALAIDPERATYVRSLDMRQQAYGANSRLQSSIARACPEVENLSIRRGHAFRYPKADRDAITIRDFQDLAELLGSCPSLSSLNHSTWTLWEWCHEDGQVDDDRETIPDNFRQAIQEDPRITDAAGRLTEFDLDDSSQWVFHAIFPDLSTKLRSLTLGQSLYLAQGDLVQEVGRRCPALQELHIGVPSLDLEDLRRGCGAWTESLRSLIVWQVEDDRTFPANFPKMQKLESIEIHCELSIESLHAFAESGPPNRLVHVELSNLEHPEDEDDDEVGDDGQQGSQDTDELRARMDAALLSLVKRHSKTLKKLLVECNGKPIDVSADVFRACKEAERFQVLYAGLHMSYGTDRSGLIGSTGLIDDTRFFFRSPYE